MTNSEQFSLGRRWEPGRLGRSIPLTKGMWRSRLAGTAIGLLAFGIASDAVYRLYHQPTALALSAIEAQQLVLDELEGLTLPSWNPGSKLAGLVPSDSHPTSADPYRTTPVETLPFARPTSLDENEGVASVLLERCQHHLRDRNPAAILVDIAKVREDLPTSEQLSSLKEWQRQLKTVLQDRLITAMATRRQRGDLAAAVAIRDYRADYLGSQWPWRAFRAWINPDLILRGFFWFTFFFAVIAAWWLVHRFVLYPYFLYTADYYKAEFHRRYEATSRRLRRPSQGGLELRDGRSLQPQGGGGPSRNPERN